MKALSIILFAIIMTGCNSGSNTSDESNVDTVKTFTRVDSTEFVNEQGKMINNLPFKIDVDAKTITKNPVVVNPAPNVDSMILALNKVYENVKLEKVKIGHDTLYTVIRESDYLGEQMGTTGASEYFANAIINLTSLEGIRYVRIDMEEHSHAMPGTFSKKNYADFKVIQ